MWNWNWLVLSLLSCRDVVGEFNCLRRRVEELQLVSSTHLVWRAPLHSGNDNNFYVVSCLFFVGTGGTFF